MPEGSKFWRENRKIAKYLSGVSGPELTAIVTIQLMLTRREALHAIMALSAPVSSRRLAEAIAIGAQLTAPKDRSPEDIARDETFWFAVQQAFTVDRGIVNLNNAGVCPAPAVVQNAMKRHLDKAHEGPPPHVLWKIQEPQIEAVRSQLAKTFGADPEEIALTRNASDGLEACQFGMELRAGDEVLTTTHDYPRMINAFKQRERREGIVLKQVEYPVPLSDGAEIVRLFESQITPKTRLILMCHVMNLTGEILPVNDVVAMARKRDVAVIVDGAHALAHFDFKISDLQCDYYGVSLHKWLLAPHGTGLLYIQRDRIKGVWPLMAAEEKLDGDIRKFEQMGTRAAAQYLAIADALQFHESIGAKNKEARLTYLRNSWLDRLRENDRLNLHTNVSPGMACAMATFSIDGLDSAKLTGWLWDKHRIFVTTVGQGSFHGIRVSPNVYTTLSELNRFCDAVERAMRDGLPG